MKFLRLSLIPLLLYSTIIVKSENITVKIYLDKNWMVCYKDRALFYRQAGWDSIENCYDGKFTDFLISEVKISEGQYEKGFIVDKKITKSPDNLLNDIALSSLNSLGQFRPAFHNGHPVKSKISSRIQFVKQTTFPSQAFGNH